MIPGIHDISNEQYHSSNGISRSMIMEFRKSPKHYWYKYLSGQYEKKEDKDALIFGNAVHTWLLEPHTFHDKYRAYDKKERRSNAGKQYYESELMAAAATNRQLLSMEDCEKIKAIAYAVDEDEQACALIKNAEYEKSIYWIDEDTGLFCKCRPDIWGNGYIADIKTSSCADYESFRRSVYKYSYDLQCAMFYEGVLHTTGQIIEDYVFLVIEKEPPYVVATYALDKTYLHNARDRFHKYLNQIAECIKNENWPSYEPQIIYENGLYHE